MHRLYVDSALGIDSEVDLELDRARYAGRVLRLGKGDSLQLFNGDGKQYDGDILTAKRQSLRVRISSAEAVSRESSLGLHLLQGIARGERMDTVIQKATELGVHRITPLLSERVVVRLDEKRTRSRMQHWRNVVISACEQCGRNSLPTVDEPQRIADLVDNSEALPACRRAFVPGGTSLRELGPRDGEDVAVLIGPEGGLTQLEIEMTEAAGFIATGLGPRILRTETAGAAAIAVLQSAYGDLS